jgi:hypothetical protein
MCRVTTDLPIFRRHTPTDIDERERKLAVPDCGGPLLNVIGRELPLTSEASCQPRVSPDRRLKPTSFPIWTTDESEAVSSETLMKCLREYRLSRVRSPTDNHLYRVGA